MFYRLATVNAIALIEYIIEHIAKKSNLDPLLVRSANLYKANDVTPFKQALPNFNVDTLVNQLKQSCDFEKRSSELKVFNAGNRWMKRGISMVTLKWGVQMLNNPVSATVSIMSNDGSVFITHSGVEMGQGLHVKLAQVCAYSLGKIPIDLISVKFTSSNLNANGGPTGGSVASECTSNVSFLNLIF